MNKYNKFRILVLTILSLYGCEKEMAGYSGTEGIYFAVQSGSRFGNAATWPYQPNSLIELIKSPGDTDTAFIKVMITGPVKDRNRPFRVEINPDSTTAIEGVHYEPLPKEIYVRADSIRAMVPVILHRTEDLKTEEKTIGLRLVANDYFSLSFPEWDAIPGYESGTVVKEFDASLHTLRINNFFNKPTIWVGSVNEKKEETGYWGEYSPAKLELMLEITGLTYDDFSTNSTMPTVLAMLIRDKMATYLIKKYNEGNPVLEDDGRLMFVGNVPWTSIIGVPWVSNH